MCVLFVFRALYMFQKQHHFFSGALLLSSKYVNKTIHNSLLKSKTELNRAGNVAHKTKTIVRSSR